MTFQEAIESIHRGRKVRLPEWLGYWFEVKSPAPLIPGLESNKIMAFTRTGDYVKADIETFSSRNDWELVDTEGLGFEWALLAAKNGKMITRLGWNASGQYVKLLHHYANKEFTIVENPCMEATLVPHLILKNTRNEYVPWVPSTGDLMSTDWILFEYPQTA